MGATREQEPSLLAVVAALRADHAGLERRVTRIDADVESLERNLEHKHKENRASIHEIRNHQQNIIDLIHKLDVKFARASGYAVGAGAMVALVVKLIDKFIH